MDVRGINTIQIQSQTKHNEKLKEHKYSVVLLIYSTSRLIKMRVFSDVII